MNITIMTVPNDWVAKRKGFTGADWWWDHRGVLQIRVAEELTDWRERAVLIVHELVEALLCKFMDIPVEKVDEFDTLHQSEETDPAFNSGDHPDAPYRIPHMFATAVERVLAGVMGIDWVGYDKRLSAL